VPVSVR